MNGPAPLGPPSDLHPSIEAASPAPAALDPTPNSAKAIPVSWQGSRSVQRALMRVLRGRLGDDAEAVCQAYVGLERRNGVARLHWAREMDAQLHARLLWREGLLEGWLRR